MSSVKISDYSDREILGIMGDLNGSGDVTAADIAVRVFGAKAVSDDEEHATRCVTSRLVWMRRFGLVMKGEKKGEWFVSGPGVALYAAKLGRSFSSAISNTPDETALNLAHQVGERMGHVNPIAQTAMRREFQWQIRRKR